VVNATYRACDGVGKDTQQVMATDESLTLKDHCNCLNHFTIGFLFPHIRLLSDINSAIHTAL
jgi:hypothetical protein